MAVVGSEKLVELVLQVQWVFPQLSCFPVVPLPCLFDYTGGTIVVAFGTSSPLTFTELGGLSMYIISFNAYHKPTIEIVKIFIFLVGKQA